MQIRLRCRMKVKRIAVYGRVSTDAQSHASQLREVRAYVRRRWPKAEVAEFERSVIIERINAGLAAARDRGATLGRPRTLDRHVSAVAKLSRRGLSGRKIAAKLKIPEGSVFAVLKLAKSNGSKPGR